MPPTASVVASADRVVAAVRGLFDRSEHFTADYPFAALVVFRQCLPIPLFSAPA